MKNKIYGRRFAAMALAASALLMTPGCGGSSSQIDPGDQRTLVSDWSHLCIEAVQGTRTSPTVTARALAIVHTAMFDAWAAYDPVAVGTRLGGTLRRPSGEHNRDNKRIAVSFAAYRTLANLFPSEITRFNNQMATLGLDPTNNSLDTTTPIGIGNVAAQAVIAYRATDGSNQAGNYADTTGYTPVNTVSTVNDIDRWQPITFVSTTGATSTPGFLTPQWGQVKSFSLTNNAQFRPVGPMLSSNPGFQARTQEVLNIQAGLTDRTKMIAEYWAQGPGSATPPGLWCTFAEWVSLRDDHSLDEDVKLFFILANALLDSSISCWETKVHFDSSRPITVIRTLFAGQNITAWRGAGLGIGVIQGQNWKPYQPDSFLTPPFAEYTSGHSTFSSAAAEVLKRFTGSDRFGKSVTLEPGSSFVEPGVTPAQPVTLRWRTFTEAAEEAGMSRLYGGIHFMDGNLHGQAAGRQVGNSVWNKAMTYINGTGTINP